MMRVICLLLVSLISLQINAQQYTKFNGYGFQADRLKADSVSIHPSDTIRNKAARSIAVLNGVFYIADGTKWKVVGTDTTSLSNRIDARVKYTDTATMLTPYSKLKSVGLTMPSAFSVANSPLTSNGTLAVTGAGTSSQYVRGDGQLANFPSNGGGGSSVNYYLNGSVNQGTFGGDTYYEMNKTPILGAGTNFTRTNGQGNGYIASFITDAGDPSLLNIPAGNWNLEFYFQSSASGGSPEFYGEIYKVSSSNVFTLVASGSANPEGITNGTTVDQYFTSISVPQTALLLTDRLAIRIYVVTGGRTITLHTENSNLCEVLTTFSTGLNALNGLTSQVQYLATGTSGTDFAISSATDTHTFNLPTASATNRGALSTTDWSTFNSKIGAGDTATMLTPYSRGSGTSGQVAYWNATRSLTGSSGFTFTPTTSLLLNNSVTAASAIARGQNITSTLTAAANGDVLVGLDVNPTFSIGSFTGTSRLASRFTGNVLIGQVPSSIVAYTYVPLTLSNNATGALKTQLSLLNGGGSTGAGSAIDFFTYTDAGNGSPGIRIAGVDNGNYSGNFQLLTKGNGSAGGGNLTNKFQIFGGTGNILIQSGGTFTDAGYKLDVNGTARIQTSLVLNGSASLLSSTLSAYQNGSNRIFSLASSTAKTDATSRILFSLNSNESSNQQGFDFQFNGATSIGDRYFSMQTSESGVAYGGGIALQANTGWVGIGTSTNSGFKFDVSGSTRLNGSTTFGSLGTATGMIWDNTNNRLGIGVTSPSYKLQVINNANGIIINKVLNHDGKSLTLFTKFPVKLCDGKIVESVEYDSLL